MKIKVDVVEPMGSDSYLYFAIGSNNLIARIRPETTPTEGLTTTLFLDRSRLHFFEAETGERVGG
jgi:multiple sugar transport system ATP-binding protein